MELNIQLVSGLFSEYVYADCYINDEYFDFIKNDEGFKLINEFGIEVPMATSEYAEIEKQLREQFDGIQRRY